MVSNIILKKSSPRPRPTTNYRRFYCKKGTIPPLHTHQPSSPRSSFHILPSGDPRRTPSSGEVSTSRRNNKPPHLPLIAFSPKFQQSIFSKARTMFHSLLKFGAIGFHEITQCRNCQRIEHAASNCNLPYRCVKYITLHGRRQCPKKPEIIPPAFAAPETRIRRVVTTA